ncbi:MAG: DNA polymerase III subunit epsilon [Gammaproteobacteria bacterium]|nr:DNA polymerase III subunit epsilon [Gammaproteobacteria bacterium]
MIKVFLDTETTGIDPNDGHRVIELGATVVEDGMHTAEEFHQLLNPEREIDEAASEIHGFRLTDLADKPKFAEIADAFIEFIRGREVFMHNAAFDVRFLDAEFERANRTERMSTLCNVTDTLALAKQVNKTGQVSLNALCTKFGVDRSDREKHGALLDSQLLAEVYLRMIESKNSLMDEFDEEENVFEETRLFEFDRSAKLIVRATPAELDAHEKYLSKIAAKE